MFSFWTLVVSLLLMISASTALSGCGGGGGSGGSGVTATSSSSQESGSSGSNPPSTPPPQPPPQVTGSFRVSWTAPTTRADGTPMSLADIDGYRIYYGTSRGKYTYQVNINNGAATGKTVSNLALGKYYLVMTTYDYSGRESARSPEISKQAM